MGTVTRTVLTVLTVVLSAPAAWGYVPELEDILNELSRRAPGVSRVILETRVEVFDPSRRLGFEEDPEVELSPPRPIAERGFRQRIYWVRGRFLAIETLSGEGEPLHIYLRSGPGTISGDLTDHRHFDLADVLHPYLPFMDGTPAAWWNAMADWGILPTSLRLQRAYKLRKQYRLMDESGANILLDAERLSLRAIEALIGVGAQPERMTMSFSEAIIYGEGRARERHLYFPRVVEFRLDGALFKRIHLVSLKGNPSPGKFPMARLRGLAAQIAPPRPISLTEHGIR